MLFTKRQNNCGPIPSSPNHGMPIKNRNTARLLNKEPVRFIFFYSLSFIFFLFVRIDWIVSKLFFTRIEPKCTWGGREEFGPLFRCGATSCAFIFFYSLKTFIFLQFVHILVPSLYLLSNKISFLNISSFIHVQTCD